VTGFVAAHRFRLAMAGCVATLAVMLTVVHLTTGLAVAWNASPGVQGRTTAP
jgi:hypothetical protein